MKIYVIVATGITSESGGIAVDLHTMWSRATNEQEAKMMFWETYPNLINYNLVVSEAPDFVYTTPPPA